MSDETREVQCIDWRRCFAFLEILRGFRMAIHPAKLALCFLGLVVTAWLAVAVDMAPAPVGHTNVNDVSCYDNLNYILTDVLWGQWALPYVDGKTWGDFFTFLMLPVSAAKEMVVLAKDYWFEEPLFALVNTVLSMAVWALVGGAVARMAAVRVAREENVPLKSALAFSLRKWPSLVTSPLIPFGVLVLVALGVGVLTGLPMMIPYAGEIVIPLLFFLTLVMGLVMAMIFVGGAFSVGLQWPTIAAEGSDSFDAISRSVAYISSRPWRYLFYTVFSLVYGCLTFIFVKFVTLAALWLTHTAVATFTWGGGEAADKLTRMWAEPTWANLWPEAGADMLRAEPFGAVIISIFVWIAIGLMVSYLFSFFFTSQTIIYFLLRRIVDATDIEEVYMEEGEEEELPVGQMAEATETSAEGETGEESGG